MKNVKSVLLLILAIVTFTPLSSASNLTVVDPVFEGTNTDIIAITKVELCDTATIIDFNASYRPNYWIRLRSGSYLETKGERYPLIQAEGIVLDAEFYMPETGEANFKLMFKPLQVGTEAFNFVEADDKDAFRIWGIDLTGDVKELYPADLPDELRKEPIDGPLPDPVMECGTTTVNVHLLGDKNAFWDSSYNIVYSSILGEETEIPLIFDKSTGVATIEIDQIGTAYATLVHNRAIADLWIAPGEVIDIYIDGRINGHLASKSRRKYNRDGGYFDKRPNKKPNPQGYIYTTGQYSNLNRLFNQHRYDELPDLWDFDKFSYRMTGDEYTNEVEHQYHEAVETVNSLDLPQMVKDEYLAILKQHVLSTLCTTDYLLEVWDDKAHCGLTLPQDSLNVKIEDRHVRQIANLIDVNSPSLLMGYNLKSYADASQLYRNVFPDESQQIRTVYTLGEMYKLAKEGKLVIDEATRALLGENVTDMIMRRNQQVVNMNKEYETMVMAVPEVPLDELFQEIIAPYKGKVIIIDLWNTWCGPCRVAIERNEPLKMGELADDDLIWIYIANETSPINKYLEMIPNIKGIHYRLTPEQWRQLVDIDFPEVDGIPAYVLVDRNGKAALRLDFRDHELMKSTIKSMIQNKK